MSKKFASVFFLKAFGIFSSIDGKQLTDSNGNLTENEGTDVYDFSLGLALGYKWGAKKRIVIEPFVDLGRQLFNVDKNGIEVYVYFGSTKKDVVHNKKRSFVTYYL